MPEPLESRELVARWRAGDQEAARHLFDRYVDRLVALSRRRIGARLASRVDPEDVVQSVFRTVFGRLRDGQFRIEEQDDLCKLLMRVTVHKTLRQAEYHGAGKRDAAREAARGDSSGDRLLEVLDRDPAPATVVAFVDHLEHFLKELPLLDRQVIELRLQGYGNEEIATRLGVLDRRVRRVVERVRGMIDRQDWLFD
ncbi:MAG TPA: sigma-70 family RNA polymerase sigma factor [Gemmataceae bacterium]|nr:sigma-70 family RNA polymerase sigma factor [Gemmataceae bacterium]